MKESMWGVFIIAAGAIGIFIITLFQNITNTDQNELNEIIESYKEGIPKEFYFLKGKIDFTAASLSLLMSIAEDEENMKLQNHLLKIQEKRNSL